MSIAFEKRSHAATMYHDTQRCQLSTHNLTAFPSEVGIGTYVDRGKTN